MDERPAESRPRRASIAPSDASHGGGGGVGGVGGIGGVGGAGGVAPGTPQADAHPARIGHYKILELLGAGILTNVYRAETDGIGRVVALKVLRSSAGPESAFYRRFEQEARLLAALRHPNLIELFDFDLGSPGERPPFMVLEHIAGATLTEVLQRLGRLSPDETAAISLEVASALAYAHGRGVVHRDVKPSNVLIGRGREGREAREAREPPDVRQGELPKPSAPPVIVKLVDFGIASESLPSLVGLRGALDIQGRDGMAGIGGPPRDPRASDTESLGTPAYMAPEQLLGEEVDHRADQFALGIVMFQMLAGVRPFDDDDGRPAIQRVRRDPPRSFRALGLTVPRALETLILRCLAKRPADRFASTTELVEELRRYFEGRYDALGDLAALHRRVLARAGVLEERSPLREEGGPVARGLRSAKVQPRAVPLRPTAQGLALAFVAMAIGGGVIQWRLGGVRSERAASAPRLEPPADGLEGSGAEGRLRVHARPWAQVLVDGENMATTPIARPLRLRAGRHVVSFVHPAATDKRVVEIRPGQTTSVDVTLPVPVPTFPDEFAVPSASAPAGAPSAPRVPPLGVPSSLQAPHG